MDSMQVNTLNMLQSFQTALETDMRISENNLATSHK